MKHAEPNLPPGRQPAWQVHYIVEPRRMDDTAFSGRPGGISDRA